MSYLNAAHRLRRALRELLIRARRDQYLDERSGSGSCPIAAITGIDPLSCNPARALFFGSPAAPPAWLRGTLPTPADVAACSGCDLKGWILLGFVCFLPIYVCRGAERKRNACFVSYEGQ